VFWRRVGLMVRKEFLELARDRLLLPLVFVMPVIQLIMFGYVVSSDVRDIPTAVVDYDGTAASRQLVRAFEDSGYFQVVARPPSEGAVRPLMDGGTIQVALVIPPRFADSMLAREPVPVGVIVDGSETKTSQVAQGYAVSILRDAGGKLAKLPPGVTAPAVPHLDVRVRVLFNPSLKSVDTMVPGLIAFILLLSTTMLMSMAVVRERERGQLEQMFVTPISRAEYLTGKIVPYFVTAGAQIFVIFTVGTLWFGVPFRGSFIVVALAALLFALTSVGQGLIISTLSRTRFQAQQAAVFVVLPSFLLSGFVFPLESMPRPVYLLTYLIPMRYFLVILRSAFLKGSGFAALAPQFAAMTLFSAGIFGIALVRFRKKIAD
jgi:ABC-2 type transport system permease protein